MNHFRRFGPSFVWRCIFILYLRRISIFKSIFIQSMNNFRFPLLRFFCAELSPVICHGFTLNLKLKKKCKIADVYNPLWFLPTIPSFLLLTNTIAGRRICQLLHIQKLSWWCSELQHLSSFNASIGKSLIVTVKYQLICNLGCRGNYRT